MTRPQGVCANFALAACAQTTYSQPIMALRKKSIFETRAERIAAYFHTLLKESDRGCVLLSTSRMDEFLADLHATYIRSTAQVSPRFLRELFGSHGPLSTFSAKVDLAFAYGLISRADQEDLHRIRAFRNAAARTTAGFSFALSSCQASVARLTAPKRIPQQFPFFSVSAEDLKALKHPTASPDTAKQYFLLAGTCLNVVLMDRIGSILNKDWEAVKKSAAASK